MEEYEYVSTLGEGAYGYVWKCQERSTGRVVAIKGFKQAHEEPEIMKLAIREVRVLQALDHPAIVQLIEAFKSKSGRVYMVFPYIGRSAYQELDLQPNGINGQQLKTLVWQLLQAMVYLHRRKVVHRDIKPANILLAETGIIKLCDFGFARPTRCGPRDAQRLSSYVVTRWYRAPEVLVSDAYGPAADIWSVGCTVAELATGQPLFPGKSTSDQLWRIMRCFGTLAAPQAERMAADSRLEGLRVPPRGRSLRERLRGCDPGLFRLIEACLQPDPRLRPTATELLQLPYFWSVPRLVAGTPLEEVYGKMLYQQPPPPTPPPAVTRHTQELVAAASVGATAGGAPKPPPLALDPAARAGGSAGSGGGVDSFDNQRGRGAAEAAVNADAAPPAVPATPDMAAPEQRMPAPKDEFDASGSGLGSDPESGSDSGSESGSGSESDSPLERNSSKRSAASTSSAESGNLSGQLEAEEDVLDSDMVAENADVPAVEGVVAAAEPAASPQAPLSPAYAVAEEAVESLLLQQQLIHQRSSTDAELELQQQQQGQEQLASALSPLLLLLQQQQQGGACSSSQIDEGDRSCKGVAATVVDVRVQAALAAVTPSSQTTILGDTLGLAESSAEGVSSRIPCAEDASTNLECNASGSGTTAAATAAAAAAASSTTTSTAAFGSYIIGREPSRVLNFATAATTGVRPVHTRPSPLAAASTGSVATPQQRPDCLSPVEIAVGLVDLAVGKAGTAACKDSAPQRPLAPQEQPATTPSQQQRPAEARQGPHYQQPLQRSSESRSFPALRKQSAAPAAVAPAAQTPGAVAGPAAAAGTRYNFSRRSDFTTAFASGSGMQPPDTNNHTPFAMRATVAAVADGGGSGAAGSGWGVSWSGQGPAALVSPRSGSRSGSTPWLADATSGAAADTPTSRLLGSAAVSGALGRCDTASFEHCPSAPSVAMARMRCGPPAPALGRAYNGVGVGGCEPQTSTVVSPSSSYYLSMAASGLSDTAFNPAAGLAECSTPTGAPMAPVVLPGAGPPPHVRRMAASASGGAAGAGVTWGADISLSPSGELDEQAASAIAAAGATATTASEAGAATGALSHQQQQQQHYSKMRAKQQQQQQQKTRRSVELQPVSAARPQLMTSRSARLQQQPQLLAPEPSAGAAAAAAAAARFSGGGSGFMHARRRPSPLHAHMHTHTLLGGGRDYGTASGVPRRLGFSYTGDPTPRMGSLLEGDGVSEAAAADVPASGGNGKTMPLPPPHPYSSSMPGAPVTDDGEIARCNGTVSLNGGDCAVGVGEVDLFQLTSPGGPAAAGAGGDAGGNARVGTRAGSRTSLLGASNGKVVPAPAPTASVSSRNRTRFGSFSMTARSVGAYESDSPPPEHYRQYGNRREGAYVVASVDTPPHSLSQIPQQTQQPQQPKQQLQRSESQKPPRPSSAMLSSNNRSMTLPSLEASGAAAVATVSVGGEEGGVSASGVVMNWSRRSRDASEAYRLADMGLDRCSSNKRKEKKKGALSKLVRAVKKVFSGMGSK